MGRLGVLAGIVAMGFACGGDSRDERFSKTEPGVDVRFDGGSAPGPSIPNAGVPVPGRDGAVGPSGTDGGASGLRDGASPSVPTDGAVPGDAAADAQAKPTDGGKTDGGKVDGGTVDSGSNPPGPVDAGPLVRDDGGLTGDCMPGAVRCDGLSAQTCYAPGLWRTVSTCTEACSEGACTGSCAPETRDCSGMSARICSASGTWTVEQECPQGCLDGRCVRMNITGNWTFQVINPPVFPMYCAIVQDMDNDRISIQAIDKYGFAYMKGNYDPATGTLEAIKSYLEGAVGGLTWRYKGTLGGRDLNQLSGRWEAVDGSGYGNSFTAKENGAFPASKGAGDWKVKASGGDATMNLIISPQGSVAGTFLLAGTESSVAGLLDLGDGTFFFRRRDETKSTWYTGKMDPSGIEIRNGKFGTTSDNLVTGVWIGSR